MDNEIHKLGMDASNWAQFKWLLGIVALIAAIIGGYFAFIVPHDSAVRDDQDIHNKLDSIILELHEVNIEGDERTDSINELQRNDSLQDYRITKIEEEIQK